MAQSSAYSYTERKRIRKSFGNRDSVVEIPYLLQMQKDAYTAFLQAGIAPKQRTVEGLQAAFDAAFPIVSHNGFVEMKFLEYNLAKPAFDVRECQTRGLTFASAVRAKVQLIIDRNAAAAGLVERTRAQGVVVGTGGDRMRFEYVPGTADMKTGDRVVTSGMDGIYPKGFVIGQIESIERTAGEFSAVLIRPAVNLSALEAVLVVTSATEVPKADRITAEKAKPATAGRE